MPEKDEPNREKILQIAMDLFYQKGYSNTSVHEVVVASGISIDQVDYYFKSKGELLSAVIELRKEDLQQKILEWEALHPEPSDRLRLIVQIMQENSDKGSRYGCPVGSLNVGLPNDDEERRLLSRSLFDILLVWCERQLQAMGKGAMSKMLAIHLMSMSQGGVMISGIYQDKQLMLGECERINLWIDSLS